MNTSTELRTARNLWYKPNNPHSRQSYTYFGTCRFTHRGVEVYESQCGAFHYLLDDAIISMRAGLTKEKAAGIIDDILDGETPESPEICAFLEAKGFKPLSFPQYMKDWEAGLRA